MLAGEVGLYFSILWFYQMAYFHPAMITCHSHYSTRVLYSAAIMLDLHRLIGRYDYVLLCLAKGQPL